MNLRFNILIFMFKCKRFSKRVGLATFLKEICLQTLIKPLTGVIETIISLNMDICITDCLFQMIVNVNTVSLSLKFLVCIGLREFWNSLNTHYLCALLCTIYCWSCVLPFGDAFQALNC